MRNGLFHSEDDRQKAVTYNEDYKASRQLYTDCVIRM